MNARERMLAMIFLGGVCLGGLGFLVYQFLVVPLRDRDANIALLREENNTKQQRIEQVYAERAKLEWWRRLSLPADIDLARREYEKYLSESLRKSGFAAESIGVTPRPVDSKTAPAIPGKGPIYTKLNFNVTAHGNLASLVEFLQRFYRTGLLQQIRNLTIQKPATPVVDQGPPRQLDITLLVEALIMNGAENRSDLSAGIDYRLAAMDIGLALRQTPGLALAVWAAAGPSGPLGRRALADPPRAYAAIAAKDIFFGPAEREEQRGNVVDVTRYVFLTDITQNERRTEAFLYDRYNNHRTRLRASPGFDSFRFLDGKGDVLVRGKVVRIEDREVIVKVDEKYFAIHVGQSLEEALQKPLTQSQIKELKLVSNDNRKSEN